jgi:hypothetical protein
MENLIRLSRDLVFRTNATPQWFLKETIDWTWRLIGIRGARGTGIGDQIPLWMFGLLY